MNDINKATAITCRHCATSIDLARSSASRRTCPNCGGVIKQQESATWINVARIANLAEAGFLTDELMGLGIEARIHHLEDFNALNDRWSAHYLIQVPAEHAEAAAAQIQTHRDDDIRSGGNQVAPTLLVSRVMDPLFWRPVALVVLTGIVSFVLGQRLTDQKLDRPVRSNSLPSVANRIGRPFVTEPVPGKPQYRLSFDGRQQAWSLETDRDNDGHYESRRQFRASGAAW